jgi:hypothetical protein
LFAAVFSNKQATLESNCAASGILDLNILDLLQKKVYISRNVRSLLTAKNHVTLKNCVLHN